MGGFFVGTLNSPSQEEFRSLSPLMGNCMLVPRNDTRVRMAKHKVAFLDMKGGKTTSSPNHCLEPIDPV
jgi:hypothetical protein